MPLSRSSITMAVLIASGCLPPGFGLGWVLRGPVAGGSRSLPAADGVDRPDQAADSTAKAARDWVSASPMLAEWGKFRGDYGNDPEAMKSLFQAVLALEPGFRRQSFLSVLAAEWAEKGPAEGLGFLLAAESRPDGGGGGSNGEAGENGEERRSFGTRLFLEWLSRDPEAAIQKLRTLDQSAGELAADPEVLLAIAHRAPGRLAEMAALSGRRDDRWNHPVEDAFALMASENPQSARDAAASLKDPQRAAALTGVAKAWGAKDFTAAREWVKTLPEGAEREAALRGAILGLATADPKAALDKIDLVPPGMAGGGTGGGTGYFLLEAAAAKDFEGTMNWLREHPGKFSRQDLGGLTDAMAGRLNADPVGFLESELKRGTLAYCQAGLGQAVMDGGSTRLPEIWKWLNSQPASEEMGGLRKAMSDAAAFSNRDLALSMAVDLAKDPAESFTMDQLVTRILGGSVASSPQLEHFLAGASASPALRQNVLMRAFGQLSGQLIGDGAQWAPRVAELPAEFQPGALRTLAREWGLKSPAEAAAWAISLPDSDRPPAVEALAKTWLIWNPLEASGWVNALPPGAARDAGASAVVDAISSETPDDAWRWAVTIQDPALRNRALVSVLPGLISADPQETRERIGRSDLPDADKQRLLEMLTRANAPDAPPVTGNPPSAGTPR